MAYFGAYGDNSGSTSNNGGGAGGWYYGTMGGGARYMYGRGAVPGAAGILGAAAAAAGWSQSVVAAMSLQAGNNQWGVESAELIHLQAMMRWETLGAAEAAAEEVLLRLHPTQAAEKRRHEIIDYAKNLIGTYFGCEVFAFGSVPLRTYLPDGDIDVTVQTNTSLDATFVDEVRRLLRTEQHNAECPFQVEDMKFIDAEVKLIKCVIGNITVDISFNQFGGVSTLCFLELVDSEVGREHLFKRSILLIKAWCHNECRILGAHHWLLSTYALEILVLHIFNVFHRCFNGPLEALHKFLEYYRDFDWDNYGLSLDGPVPLSSLRQFGAAAAAEPIAVNDELLLSMEPLRSSFERLLHLPADADTRDAKFRVKYLNIIDPLKCSNNLGRSVSEENYHRIRNAFASGAEKFAQILLQSPESVPSEVFRLFEKTLKRYGTGERQDLNTARTLLQSPEMELNEDVPWSSGTSSRINEDESCSPDDAQELTGKAPQVLPAENGSSSSNTNQCHGDSAQECSSSNSHGTADANEAQLLLPFSSPGLLNLTGELGNHLGCLRLVQYNLEALFDDLQNRIHEASGAGLLNEETFRTTASGFLSDVHAHSAHQQNVQLPPGPQAAPNGGPPTQPPVADAGMHNVHPMPYAPAMVVPLPPHNPRFHSSKPNGTGTYIPLPSGLYIDYAPRWQRPRQTNHVQAGSPRVAGERSRSQTPVRQNTPQQQAPRAAHFRPRSSTGGRVWKPLNSQPRAEDGSSGAASSSSSQPPTLAVPNHGDDTQGIHLAVAAASGPGESSSPAAVAGESSSVPAAADAGESSRPAANAGEPSTPSAAAGEPSTPAVTAGESSTPAVSAGESAKPAAVAAAAESLKPAATGKDLAGIEEEKLEFGSLGPLSPTLFTPKFIQDFPPLPATKKATAPTLKVSWPAEASGSAQAQQSTTRETAESSAPSVPSPRQGPAAPAQTRPEAYRLKDEADFPPLQRGTR